MSERLRADVIGSPIDVVSWDEAINRVRKWASRHESRVVSICNVHSVVTALSDPKLSAAIRNADLATADGAPIAFFLRILGHKGQQRINGPDLMWKYCSVAEAEGQAIFLLGATDSVLDALRCQLLQAFPNLKIVGAFSPPFVPDLVDWSEFIIDLINSSGAHVVWVGLGCPKQEKWMIECRGRVRAVMIGVGAAFDYHSGGLRRAPIWMRASGLEWLFRLLQEPRRLWRRYLVTNSTFVVISLRQLLRFNAGRR